MKIVDKDFNKDSIKVEIEGTIGLVPRAYFFIPTSGSSPPSSPSMVLTAMQWLQEQWNCWSFWTKRKRTQQKLTNRRKFVPMLCKKDSLSSRKTNQMKKD